jgi:hypothetical protein
MAGAGMLANIARQCPPRPAARDGEATTDRPPATIG